MNAAFLFSLYRPYLEMAFLVLIGAGFLAIAPALLDACGIRIERSHWLKIGNSALVCSILFPLLALFLPKETLLRPSAQVWSGISRSDATNYALVSGVDVSSASSTVSSQVSGLTLSYQIIGYSLIALGAGACLSLLILLYRVFQLRRFLEGQPVMKSLGRVKVLISDEPQTPFSAWLPGSAYIVLPSRMLTQLKDCRIALRHEAQHHRQGDTRWVYGLELLKALFFWNPASYWLSRTINHLQEFACDEALIGHRNVSPQAYGSCLLMAAELAVGSRPILVGTTSMAASSSGTLLKRRIEMMFKYKTLPSRKSLSTLLAVGTLGLMASVAFAARSSIQDRKLTMSEARGFAEIASQGSEIPITVNELVLDKLNRYIGTPEGRKFVKEGMTRMPIYQAMIERKINEYNMPRDLIALALHESGFRNDLISPRPYHAAGIWQFIPTTARRYGLVAPDKLEDMVPGKDERLNPEKETDAAMRYLQDLNNLFQDWRLAMKAYNEGESRVQKLIDQYGTRDPWTLERADSTEGYLSGAMAMIIILKNPSLLN